MEVLVIDQIIAHLEENPSADPIEVLNDYKRVAIDQICDGFIAGVQQHCDEFICRNERQYMRNHFNIDV